MLNTYLEFLGALDPADFFQIFWLFCIFELPRYIILDVVVVFIYLLHQNFNSGAYADARRRLYLERPLISVIVPGKNEGHNFAKLCRTLKEQTYSHYELIVVDDGSDDDSAIIGRDLQARGDIDLFLRNELRGGKASAANLALRFANGPLILHLDADCSLDRDAIEKMIVPFYLDPKIGAVGGSLDVRNADENLCTAVQSIEYLISLSFGRLVTSSLGILRIISGAFGAFRTEILRQVGGWDIGPGLDGDITVKIRKAGYRIHQEVHAIAATDVPSNFAKLARQRLRWSRSLVRFRLRKHLNVYAADENFGIWNMMSFVENVFFNVVLSISWFVYFGHILISYDHYIGFILLTNFLLYSAGKYVQFGAMMVITKRRGEKLHLLPFLPLMVLYVGYYLRVVRTVAYVSEFFFKASYEDPWNPMKTSRMAKHYNM